MDNNEYRDLDDQTREFEEENFEIPTVEIISYEDDDDSYEQIFSLTAPTDDNVSAFSDTGSIIAKFDQIKTTDTYEQSQKLAKKVVDQISGFIVKLDDGLSEDHKKLIKNLAQYEVSNVAELDYLANVSKQIIDNIVEKINVTMGDDPSQVALFSKLVTDHIKIRKELRISLQTIATNLKRVRADVMVSQELGMESNQKELMTKDYGTLQFNNDKEFLKELAENYEADTESK